MPLAAWLLSMVSPLVVRVIIALGFTAVSFASVTVAANTLLQNAQMNWSAMPLAVLQIAHLTGIDICLGMIAGAYMARLAVWSTINATKYVLKA